MNDAYLSAGAARGRDDTRIGALLQAAGKLGPEHGERVLRLQGELGIRYGEAARRLGLADEDDIAQALARQFGFPTVGPGELACSPLLAPACAPFGPHADMVRAVRSALLPRWFDGARKALVVAGAGPGHGASLFAANLAICFAQLGRDTLLIDADLRRPALQALFNAGMRQGLSDMLAGRLAGDQAEALPHFGTLALVGAGTVPPNPLELLSRPAMAALHANFSAHHEVVLYDAPPAARGPDALLLAAHSGGVLLVARKDHTSSAALGALGAQVAACGAQVVGAVLLEFA